jgi:hypothetical protein
MKIGIFVDGSFLPCREGATQRFYLLAKHENAEKIIGIAAMRRWSCRIHYFPFSCKFSNKPWTDFQHSIHEIKIKSDFSRDLYFSDILNTLNDFVRVHWRWNLRRFMHDIKIRYNNSFKSFFKVTQLV